MEDLMVVEPIPYPRGKKNLTTKNTCLLCQRTVFIIENVGL